MKAKKLAETLLKNPSHEVRIVNGNNGNTYTLGSKVDVRTGVLFLHTENELSWDEDGDEGTMFPFNPKEALTEAKELLSDLRGEELSDFLAEYKVGSKDEFMTLMKKDEKKLRKLAKDYFHMK